jgi:quercetin dioxygenase-like cupin family protein
MAMYSIEKGFRCLEYKSLQIRKLVESDALEVLGISLEKGHSFPEHTSPRDAHLLVLEGRILFHIQGNTYELQSLEHFHFPGLTAHFVNALEDSKFIIIR